MKNGIQNLGKRIIALFCVLWVVGPLSADELPAGPHTFTSPDGRMLRAIIISKSEAGVRVLRAKDGKEFVIPMGNLSDEDQVFVREWRKPSVNDLGELVLAFGRANLGKRVGRGECAHLAVESLKAVNAAPRGKDSPRRGDYVWGDLVAFLPAGMKMEAVATELAKVKPGDLIQIYGARFKGKRASGGRYTSNAAHHTVMVEWIDPEEGGIIHILHQNVSGVRSVMRGKYKLADLKTGWLRVYRPVTLLP